MDITQKLRNVVRAIVGLPEDPGQPPQIDRLAWYRAQVTACASDGTTCDVQPEDPRISPENGVKVLVGIPGLVGVVQVGAVVHLGWERGDPARPRCVPIWEMGATVQQLILNAAAIYLGGQSGAQAAARQNDGISLGQCSVTLGSVGSGTVTGVTINGVALTATPADPGGKISGGSSVVKIK